MCYSDMCLPGLLYEGKASKLDTVSAQLWVKAEVISGHGALGHVIYISTGKRLQKVDADPNSDLCGWCQHLHCLLFIQTQRKAKK